MKKLLLFLSLITGNLLYAQVGIGTDMPNPSSQLEIVSSNRGVLIPQVRLTGITDQTTITAGNLESLLVYNTSTNATVTPGYYYWFKNSWHRFLTEADLPDYRVFWDVVTNQFNYIDANGAVQLINISDLETLTYLGLNANGHTLEYSDENGTIKSINLATVIKNFETLTVIVNNGDGTFTYTDEQGSGTIIDIANMETLTYLAMHADSKTLEYTDENGATTAIDLEIIIKNFETFTTLTLNADGKTLEYKDEAGNTNTIDLKTVIKNNQDSVTVVDGENTTVTNTVLDNNTEYKVNVATATDTNLGVVKQAEENPSILINSAGELSVDLSTVNAIKEISTNYTLTKDDSIILGNAAGGDVTITLPAATATNKGKKVTIKKQDANEHNYVTVTGNIDGLTQLYTALPYSGWDLVSDGNQWKIVNKF